MSAVMAALSLLSLALLAGACDGGLFRQYEYEEEMYLSLDGSATIYVNSSLAALNALRGAAFHTNPNTPVDRDAVSSFFTTPLTRVNGSVQTFRRSNRRFVHVRIEVVDITRLGDAPPFAWSRYQFGRDGDQFVFRQTVGASSAAVVSTNWTGKELVAFRIHVPSKVVFHNAGTGNLKRGNILVWEQLLAERQQSVPLVLETRVETQSILYRTLWLFGATIVAVAVMFGAVIWLIVRRGARRPANSSDSA